MNHSHASSLPSLVLEPGEQALTQAIESLEDAILVTRSDLEWPGPTIVAASSAMSTLTGYGREEMVGRSPRMFQGALTDRSVLDQLRAACTQGRHFAGETVNYRKDGSSYILQWTVDPVRDPAGHVTHFCALQRDVTALRPFAREWLEAEARAREAHEALGVHLGAIAETILVLEATKRSFQSKELGELRRRLLQLSRRT